MTMILWVIVCRDSAPLRAPLKSVWRRIRVLLRTRTSIMGAFKMRPGARVRSNNNRSFSILAHLASGSPPNGLFPAGWHTPAKGLATDAHPGARNSEIGRKNATHRGKRPKITVGFPQKSRFSLTKGLCNVSLISNF